MGMTQERWRWKTRFHILQEVKVSTLDKRTDTSPGLNVASGVGRLMEWVIGRRVIRKFVRTE